MTRERWQRIESLYYSALGREKGRRSAFLADACEGDEELRREVESLLAQPSSLLDRPAWRAAPSLTGDPTRTGLAAGTELGPYKIESPLGAGGMGQVYKARDTRLNRAVAIKIMSEQFSDRFEREARAISALNHPRICTLYDVGPNYLVMELVEGETLAARLKNGALPTDQVLQHGAQAADALAAAHAKGITHRDLKPSNIMLTKSGVKVLDFGLAKSHQDETVTATQAVIGTPAYMAPEQREGRDCDARTDIYALGLVLYEMATGRRAAPGVTPQLDSLPDKLAHVAEHRKRAA
jgi:serine/threonine protein kinase